MLESDGYIIKSCKIKDKRIFQEFFKLMHSFNNDLFYRVLKTSSGSFLFHHNSHDIYAYEKVKGDVFVFNLSSASLLGSALAALHNVMDIPEFRSNDRKLEKMVSVFLSHEPDSLYNGQYRKRYVLDFIDTVPDFLDKPQNFIHGDMWKENIIISGKNITFIDFDSMHLFYKDYEVMRCFFISFLDSIIDEKKTIIELIEKYQNYFISYMNVGSLDLNSAFNFYLFVFCLECDVEDQACHDSAMLSFLIKRQYLLMTLIEKRLDILSVFNGWAGDLNVI
ncbi:phosphotransferase [Kosakonia oryzendophytica]|uniref:phosphotransferase n=1 Tax=Kosakonia oryzendophytica TaxID=1005665 RepID=UPI003D33DE0F